MSSTAYHKAIVPKDATREEIEEAFKAIPGAKLLPGTKHRLYENYETGVGIMLPGWSYPIVISDTGTIAYDHYHGKWGNPQHLTAFENNLAHNVTTRKVLATAAAEGMAVVHNEVQADGTRVIRVQVGSDRAQVSQMVGGGSDFVEGVRI